MKKWILNLLIVVFMIAFSGNVYALDTDYKVNDQTYSTLEEAVEAINIGNEDEYSDREAITLSPCNCLLDEIKVGCGVQL